MQGVKEFFGEAHLAAINYGTGSNFSSFQPTVIPFIREYIVVTESENVVAKFKIGLGGIVAEKEVFTFSELKSLLLPAVPYMKTFHKSKGRKREHHKLALVTVHSGNELCISWRDERNETKTNLITSFQNDIVALVPGTVPIVVFRDGSVVFINHVAVSEDSCLKENETICDVRMIEKDFQSKSIDIVLMVKDKNEKKFIVLKSYLSKSFPKWLPLIF